MRKNIFLIILILMMLIFLTVLCAAALFAAITYPPGIMKWLFAFMVLELYIGICAIIAEVLL